MAYRSKSAGRAWKGCHMCKMYKDRRGDQNVRKPFSELRRIGKRRKVSRHDLGDAA